MLRKVTPTDLPSHRSRSVVYINYRFIQEETVFSELFPRVYMKLFKEAQFSLKCYLQSVPDI